MYYIKFYKKDYYYFYVIHNKKIIKKCLLFSELISFLEENSINFKKVHFSCTLDDLFFHVVDYNSIKRVLSYDKFESEKKKKGELYV